MSGKKGQDNGGICNADRLRDRCRIDEETGCWRMEASTIWLRLPEGGYKTCRPRRAAIIVSTQKDVPRGLMAYATPKCVHADCARPDHATLGTRSAWMKAAAARGAFDTPARWASIARASGERRILTHEQRAEIANSRENGGLLAARYGISRSLVNAIRSISSGRTMYRERPAVASVFDWRPA